MRTYSLNDVKQKLVAVCQQTVFSALVARRRTSIRLDDFGGPAVISICHALSVALVDVPVSGYFGSIGG